MRFWKKKKYQVKGYKVDRGVKPSMSYLNPWSKVFFTVALAGLVWGSVQLLGLTEYEYFDKNAGSGTEVAVNDPNTQNQDPAEEQIKTIDPEDLQNIQNTIAFTHAIWPGYKGDIYDGGAVRKHFSQNLAKIIVQNGGSFESELGKSYRIHFYYVVRKDGAIQYLAIVKKGKSSSDLPVYLVKHTQKTMSIGIPGIEPGTNSAGEPITVVYELLIKFTPGG